MSKHIIKFVLIIGSIIMIASLFASSVTNFNNSITNGLTPYFVTNTSKTNQQVISDIKDLNAIIKIGTYENEIFYNNIYKTNTSGCNDNYQNKNLEVINLISNIQICEIEKISTQHIDLTKTNMYLDQKTKNILNSYGYTTQPLNYANTYQKNFFISISPFLLILVLILSFIILFKSIIRQKAISIQKLNGYKYLDIIKINSKNILINIFTNTLVASSLVMMYFFLTKQVDLITKYLPHLIYTLLLVNTTYLFLELIILFLIVKKLDLKKAIKNGFSFKKFLRIVNCFVFLFTTTAFIFLYFLTSNIDAIFTYTKSAAKYEQISESYTISASGSKDFYSPEQEIDHMYQQTEKYQQFYKKYNDKLNGIMIYSDGYYMNSCQNINNKDTYEQYCALLVNENYFNYNDILLQDGTNLKDYPFDQNKIYVLGSEKDIVSNYIFEPDYQVVNLKLKENQEAFSYNSERSLDDIFIKNPIMIVADYSKYGYENIFSNSSGNYFLNTDYQNVVDALGDVKLSSVDEAFSKNTQFNLAVYDLIKRTIIFLITLIILICHMIFSIYLYTYFYIKSNIKKISIMVLSGYNYYSCFKGLFKSFLCSLITLFSLSIFLGLYGYISFIIIFISIIILLYILLKILYKRQIVASIKEDI